MIMSRALLVARHRIRENGTLQKGTFSISNNPREEYGDTYHLVAQCARNWSDEEKQRYAIAVVLEHSDLHETLFGRVNLYEAVHQQIEAKARIRLKV